MTVDQIKQSWMRKKWIWWSEIVLDQIGQNDYKWNHIISDDEGDKTLSMIPRETRWYQIRLNQIILDRKGVDEVGLDQMRNKIRLVVIKWDLMTDQLTKNRNQMRLYSIVLYDIASDQMKYKMSLYMHTCNHIR